MSFYESYPVELYLLLILNIPDNNRVVRTDCLQCGVDADISYPRRGGYDGLDPVPVR